MTRITSQNLIGIVSTKFLMPDRLSCAHLDMDRPKDESS
jgi:hypothetical protein